MSPEEKRAEERERGERGAFLLIRVIRNERLIKGRERAGLDFRFGVGGWRVRWWVDEAKEGKKRNGGWLPRCQHSSADHNNMSEVLMKGELAGGTALKISYPTTSAYAWRGEE